MLLSALRLLSDHFTGLFFWNVEVNIVVQEAEAVRISCPAW
jgi:hypothetical protein